MQAEPSVRRFKLSEKFIDQYREADVPWGPLGYVTFKRTYSRRRDEFEPGAEGTEEWYETCRRVIEGMFHMQKQHVVKLGLEWNDAKAQRTAKDAFDRLFNLKWTPPGRGLWMMGTKYVEERTQAGLFNCSFRSTEDIDQKGGYLFAWMMDALMLGIGVGFDTKGAGKVEILQPRFIEDVCEIPDSREGWVQSVRLLLDGFFLGTDIPNFSYDLIRPYGSPIHGFGGTASGSGPLKELHESLVELYTNRVGETITSVDIVDTENLIGRCVVAGNVRRSAALALGGHDDMEYLTMKNDKDKMEHHRWGSNNSFHAIVGQDYTWHAQQSQLNGEPGYIWLDNARTRGRMKDAPRDDDLNVAGFNPCSEQQLHSAECCCLVETFPAKHADFEDYLKTLKVAYLYGKTVTLANTHWPETNAIMLKNRRIGLSQSGVIQAFNKHGRRTMFDWCNRAYDHVLKLDKAYSDWLCIPKSIRVSSIKPSGCRPINSLVTTDTGILTLAEIQQVSTPIDDDWFEVEDHMLAGKTSKRVTKFYSNGVSNTVRIKLNYGLEFESTLNHKWFITQHHRGQGRYLDVNDWVEARDIVRGDIVDLDIEAYRSEKETVFRTFDYVLPVNSHENDGIRLPEKMSSDIAWFLGYLWGDGSISPSKYRIRFIDENLENLVRAQSILKNEFGLDSSIHKASEGRNAWTLEKGSKVLYDWLSYQGISKHDGSNGIANIPLCVRSSSRQHIIEFVAGLIDSDGCVFKTSTGRGNFSIATAYDKFATHLQHVMWAIGLPVGRSLNSKGTSKQSGEKHIWLLTGSMHIREDDFETLRSASNKLNKSEFEFRYDPSNMGVKIAGKVVAVEDAGRQATFDVEVNDEHAYYAGAAYSHNTVSLLNGSTPGIHFPEDEYYIRRIRFAHTHELVERLRNAGYKIEKDVCSPNTVCVEFPVHEPHFIKGKREVSMWEQLEIAAAYQHFWADNSVSVTITFKPEEGDQIADALQMYEHKLKAVSFLKYEETGYVQAPYEPITKKQYETLVQRITPLQRVESKQGGVGTKFCDGDTCML